MANFTSYGRLGNLGDIQRNYMWELYIPDIAELNQDDMVVRIRTASIPGRTITAIESFFMGTKQFFPGKTEYAGTFTTNIEEFDDQKVYKAIDSWQQLIFDHGIGNDAGGSAGAKKDIVRDITLKMYKHDQSLLGEIIFYNAWPQAIAEGALDMAGAEGVKFDVTWQYDFWRPKA